MAGNLTASSMIQANGGNDTIDVTGSISGSTVYGGQGVDYISGVDGAATITGSVIAGNLGADSIILNSTSSVYNTAIYGSDSSGTDTSNDSIVIGARTIQTSTVYGGAGADTLILGESSTLGQFVDGDYRAFAGNDSVAVTGSFVSVTVRGGTGNDTISITGDTASGEGSSNTAIYAGDGTDSLIATGRGVTVYGGNSAASTTDGADTLSLTSLYDSTVYGAAGADSFLLGSEISKVRIEGGADATVMDGASGSRLNETTILGGAAADSLTLQGVATGGYFDVAGGADTLVFAGIVGSSSAKATVLGGAGADTLGSTGQYSYTSLTGGDGADSIYTTGATSDADNSTILGGAGNDTLEFAGGATSSVKGEAGEDTITPLPPSILPPLQVGNDSIVFTGVATSSKIVGGAGNDTNFASASEVNSGSTFYFGNGDGDDKIYFAASFTSASSAGLTIAVDSALGATSAFNFAGAASSTKSTITFDTSGAGSIFISGASGGEAGGNGTGLRNITFVTVSSSTITDLG